MSKHPQPAASNAFVDFADVGLRYGDESGTLALSHVDLSIEKGQFAADRRTVRLRQVVVHETGDGLARRTEGTIRVAGAPVTGPLKITGMAFQNPTLLPWRDTLGNVMLPLEIVQPHRSRLRSGAREIRSTARDLLATVGWRVLKTSSRGCCRAACSSAPACAAR